MSKTPDQWCDEGNTLKGQGNKREAVDAYDEAININPNFGRAYYLKAIVVADLDRVTEAVELYKKLFLLATIRLLLIIIWVSISIIWEEEKKQSKPIQRLLRKILKKLTPTEIEVNSQMMLNRVQDAVDSYAKALELKSDNYAVYADIGPLLEDLGRRDEAVKYYDTCISKDPNNC